MGYSRTEIANMALSHIGSGAEIENLDTDPSEQAAACRVNFNLVLGTLLEDFDWWFCRKIVALGLVALNPNSEWLFSYRWPSDCKKLLRILSGQREDDESTRVEHIGGVDDQGRLIFTDQENAEVEYIFLPENTGNLPDYFVETFSFKLAQRISSRITREDPAGMAAKMEVQHLRTLDRAKVHALEDEQRQVKAQKSASTRARG